MGFGFAIGEEPVIPDTMEVFWQHMIQEPFDKGHGRHRGCLPSGLLFGVFEPELNPSVFFGNDPVIADSTSMCVPTNIFDHFFRPGKGRLGENHPLFWDLMVEPLPECGLALKEREFTRQVESSLIIDILETFKKFSPEYPGQCLDRKKEGCIVLRGHPLAVRGYTASCYDIVNMGMRPQLTTPGVKDAVESDSGPQTFGVVSKIKQGSG